MTDTWDSLTAEQKNALVATDAMGWHKSRGPSGEPEWRYKSVARACSVKDFRPTEKIEQAWEVLEWHGWDYDISSTETAGGVRSVRVYLDVGDNDVTVVASTAAEAICHAAILAVGGMNDA